MKPFDVCVVGHVTRDTICSGDSTRCGVGGLAYYAALALQRLGVRVAVATRMADRDREELLSELRSARIPVYCRASEDTSHFHCVYATASQEDRTLTVSTVAQPFERADLEGISARWFLLGPLTRGDMSAEFIRVAHAKGRIALDAQGLIRHVDGGSLRELEPDGVESLLQHVSLLKVDAGEAAILSEQAEAGAAAQRLRGFGPEEVILTRGSAGSLVLDAGGLHTIDAVPGALLDATGCGDTYLAAYLSRRLRSEEPALAGRFAAAAAALSLERVGAFRASEAEVHDRMR